jgi:hypothetical protein
MLRNRGAVTAASEHYCDVALDAVVDGDYDKTGLPDPLELTYYFTIRDSRIVRLILTRGPRIDGGVDDDQ